MTTKKEVIAIKGFANYVLRGESYLITLIHLGLSHPLVAILPKNCRKKTI
jgi:hypothetical protein